MARVDDTWQVAGVAVDDFAVSGSTVLAGEAQIGGGELRPSRFVFDPDSVPAEVHRFDQGGADAAHGIQDQVAGLGVGGDRLAGDRGEHLGWMLGA